MEILVILHIWLFVKRSWNDLDFFFQMSVPSLFYLYGPGLVYQMKKKKYAKFHAGMFGDPRF